MSCAGVKIAETWVFSIGGYRAAVVQISHCKHPGPVPQQYPLLIGYIFYYDFVKSEKIGSLR